jgi:hypothetical protein
MPKHTQTTLPADVELVLPERVTIALAELPVPPARACSHWRWGPAWACWGAC